MNILEINTVDTRGGAAKVAYSLKSELKKRGHTVSLFVKVKSADDTDVHVITQNAASRMLRNMTGKDIGGYLSRKLHSLLATDIEFFNSDSILHSEEYKKADIIHCHNLHGNYFNLRTLQKMARDKPVIWTFHDMWAITPHCAHAYSCPVKEGFFECPSLDEYQQLRWHNERHLRSMKRGVYEQSAFTVVVPCRWLYEKVQESLLKEKKMSLIYNGIDTEKFHRSDKTRARQALNLPLDKKIIIFLSVGKNSSFKGSEYFLQLATHYKDDPDVLFLSIGGARKQTEGASLPNSTYIGYVDGAEMLATYYSAGDLLLCASLAETFPLTVLEAMSCGMPVVSFDVGGVKESLIHKVNGYIAKHTDTEDLLSGVKYILGLSPNEQEQMSLNSVSRVRDLFSKERMVEEYLALYTDAIRNFKN